MRLNLRSIEDGIHPSQLVVSIAARDGEHFLTVARSSVIANAIEVGNVLGRQDEYRLVELPDETDDGRWRLWVKDTDLNDIHHKLEAAE